jgi:ParB family chromosome partitioning protein
MTAIAVNPLRCRIWNLHPRLEENLTEESCRMEIESFEKHGQLIPVLGRRLRGNPDYDIELIYGARRLFVARHLGMPLKVELRDICDREGIIAMEAENRLRRDISPYERALSYSRWLREGHFRSQGEIANALQVSQAQVSRLLKLAKLPDAIVNAFATPADLCEAWGERLVNLLADPHVERQFMHLAREIASGPRPPAEKIFAQFCAAAKASRSARSAERVVLGLQGEEMFRVRHQRGAVVIKVPLDRLSRDLLAQIERSLARVMDPNLPDETDELIGPPEPLPRFAVHGLRSAEGGARTVKIRASDDACVRPRPTLAGRKPLSGPPQERAE